MLSQWYETSYCIIGFSGRKKYKKNKLPANIEKTQANICPNKNVTLFRPDIYETHCFPENTNQILGQNLNLL